MRSLLQFTLDLFGAEPAPPVEAPRHRVRPKRPGQRPNQPANHQSKSPEVPAIHQEFATDFVVTGPQQPAQPLGDAMRQAHFLHPRANREARLNHVHVAYEFKRGKRRTIGFQVGPDGLVVSAPKWVPLYEVDRAVAEKAHWIVKKLGEVQDRHARLESARILWRDGATFPFLGETVTVLLDPRHAFGGAGAQLDPVVNPATGESDLTLQVALPHNATPDQIRDVVQAWLMRQAKRIFTERLNHFAPLLQVQWCKLSLSSAGTRWGSASASGAIRLNWRLVHFRLNVIDYVVAHELSHLRVMDHSPRFWDTVRTVVPDYATLRHLLKDDSVPRWK
jgi:predicted metal-dependent hydrolase